MYVMKGCAFFVVSLVFLALAGEISIAIGKAGYHLDVITMFIYLLFGCAFMQHGVQVWRFAGKSRRERRHQAAADEQRQVLESSWSQRLQEAGRGD